MIDGWNAPPRQICLFMSESSLLDHDSPYIQVVGFMKIASSFPAYGLWDLEKFWTFLWGFQIRKIFVLTLFILINRGRSVTRHFFLEERELREKIQRSPSMYSLWHRETPSSSPILVYRLRNFEFGKLVIANRLLEIRLVNSSFVIATTQCNESIVSQGTLPFIDNFNMS